MLKPGHSHGEYRTYEAAYGGAIGQLAYYRILEKEGEARILATVVDAPNKVSEEQMERWAAEIDSWDICDGCCANLDRAPRGR